MQSEPIQFGSVNAARAKRSVAGFMTPVRSARRMACTENVASVLDAAFADFTRIDSGSPSHIANKTVPNNSPALTQALIADIATQLEILDGQRRQLARLLESVDTGTISS